MIDNDWDALAKAAWASDTGAQGEPLDRMWTNTQKVNRLRYEDLARAVVAAYEAQRQASGMVVLRGEDLRDLTTLDINSLDGHTYERVMAALHRIAPDASTAGDDSHGGAG